MDDSGELDPAICALFKRKYDLYLSLRKAKKEVELILQDIKKVENDINIAMKEQPHD